MIKKSTTKHQLSNNYLIDKNVVRYLLDNIPLINLEYLDTSQIIISARNLMTEMHTKIFLNKSHLL